VRGITGEGVVVERKTQQRAGEVPDFMCSKVVPGEVLQLGKEGKCDTRQEEATKDDDSIIPYNLWDSRLTRLRSEDAMLKLQDYGMQQAAEVL
jgi:hypothetical protein